MWRQIILPLKQEAQPSLTLGNRRPVCRARALVTHDYRVVTLKANNVGRSTAHIRKQWRRQMHAHRISGQLCLYYAEWVL